MLSALLRTIAYIFQRTGNLADREGALYKLISNVKPLEIHIDFKSFNISDIADSKSCTFDIYLSILSSFTPSTPSTLRQFI